MVALERRIGDIAVSAIGLGGANWSFREPRDDDRIVAFIRDAVSAGVTLIDTARAYTTRTEPSHNERLIARALAGRTEDVLVATKAGHYRAGDDFPVDGRPESLRRDCEASLRALDVEAIGLYLLHHPDPAVPIDESVGALEQLRAEGKIRLIGVSNVSPEQYRLATEAAPTIAAVENEFSPFAAHDAEFIRQLEADGIAYLAYSPLGGGRRSAGELPIAFHHVAGARRTSTQQVMLSWELRRAGNLIPLVGASRLDTVLDSLAATEIELDSDEMIALDASVDELRSKRKQLK
jgi:aryl-alcohol dehydrogenase-like predicted oxidoreductase